MHEGPFFRLLSRVFCNLPLLHVILFLFSKHETQLPSGQAPNSSPNTTHICISVLAETVFLIHFPGPDFLTDSNLQGSVKATHSLRRLPRNPQATTIPPHLLSKPPLCFLCILHIWLQNIIASSFVKCAGLTASMCLGVL